MRSSASIHSPLPSKIGPTSPFTDIIIEQIKGYFNLANYPIIRGRGREHYGTILLIVHETTDP